MTDFVTPEGRPRFTRWEQYLRVPWDLSAGQPGVVFADGEDGYTKAIAKFESHVLAARCGLRPQRCTGGSAMSEGGMSFTLVSPRCVVTELKGFLTAARGTGKPGTSFHVIDRHRNHQLVGTWRTEDFGRGGLSAIERARSRAEALAAKLDQASPVQVVARHVYAPFRPTCPHEECAVICDSDALYCAECGTRLYTLESGRYGAKS